MTEPIDEREVAFRAELKALLAKFGAELSADDQWRGYAECGEDVRMTVSIPGTYKDGEKETPWLEIDLGRQQDGKP